MTEKESKKGKKRTGKLLSSFVVLTIVLSVLAVTMLPASAQPTVTRSIDPDTVSPGDVVDVTISFTTTEDMAFPVLQDVVPFGWDVTDWSADPAATISFNVSGDSTVGYLWGTLGSGVDVTTSYKLHVPGDAADDDYPLNGALKKLGSHYANVTGDDTVTVIGPYGVELTVDQAERKVAPNENATYTLTVKNTGNTGDTFDIAIDNVPAEATATLSAGVTPELAPDGTYDVSLNVSSAIEDEYIVNVTATSQGDPSKSDKVTTKTNVSLDLPDLIVTEITPNCGYLFGNESNNVSAIIKNVGTEAAGAFNVNFTVDAFSDVVSVSGLDVGASKEVTITDPTLRNAGDLVTITVTIDLGGKSNSTTVTVMNNGYKGKTYTGGANITTLQTHTLNGSVLYSVGDSYYLSSGTYPNWTTYNVSWNISDLPVPANASVEKARLYVPYTWDKEGVMPGNVNLVFNGNAQILDAHYSDEKGWATSYPYGMLAYNVTADFNTSGNVANLTNLYPGGNNVSMRGMLLVVVYGDNSEPQRTIIINEGFDLLYGGSSKCTTPEEATAYAPFAGTIGDIDNKSARLITVAPGAGPTEGELIFNGNVWNNVWNFEGATQIGINDRDVTQYLLAENNEAAFQSNGDWMEASNAILVVEVQPEKEFTIDFVTGYNMISMPVNDTSVTNASLLMDEIGADCTEIFKWNTTTPGWESYNPGMPSAAAFDIVGGEGYFVSMSGPETVVFTGIGWESPFSMSLVTGYNMIGIPVNDTSVTNASLLMDEIGADCTEIFKWNTTTPGWESYNPGMPSAAAFDIGCGEGYFVSMAGPADITFVGEPCQD